MKYTITLYNEWKRPYFYVDKTDSVCTNVESSSYTTDDINLTKTIVKDFLDVPETELTLDEIRRQFEDPGYCSLPQERLLNIQNYYNGRLALYKTAIDDINKLNADQKTTLKYDIPYEYNHFTVEDEELDNEKQIAAYLEIKVDKDEY